MASAFRNQNSYWIESHQLDLKWTHFSLKLTNVNSFIRNRNFFVLFQKEMTRLLQANYMEGDQYPAQQVLMRQRRREDLSLRDTKLCNILINKQAFMNSPMTHAESRWYAHQNIVQCRIDSSKHLKPTFMIIKFKFCTSNNLALLENAKCLHLNVCFFHFLCNFASDYKVKNMQKW